MEVYFDEKDGNLYKFTLAGNVAHISCCQIRADDNSPTCAFTTGKSVLLM